MQTIGTLSLDFWEGRTTHKVEILKEITKKYKIKWLDDNLFQGKFVKNNEYYVPKHAVKINFL
jgi:hypothetical protein